MSRLRTAIGVAVTALVAAVAFGWLVPWLVDLITWCRERGEVASALLPALGAALAIVVVVWAGVSPATADAYVQGLHDTRQQVRQAPARLAGLVVGVGLGVPLGYEGPAVYFGGALGATVPQRTGWSERPFVLAGGTAAVAMVIDAPLAAALFAVEVARRGRPRATDLLALGAGGGAVWLVRLWRDEPAGLVGADPGGSVWRLAVAAGVIAVAGAVIGRWFVHSVRRAKDAAPGRSTRRRIVGAVVPLLVAVPLAQWATGQPVLFGSGRELSTWATTGNRLGVLVLLVVFVGLVATLVRAGVVGGLFLPMIAVGATVGVLLDRTVLPTIPVAVAVSIGACVLVAVAYGTPLTAVALAVSRLGWGWATVAAVAAVGIAHLLGGRRSVSIYQT
jgi:CIC family chloride channel protein